MVCGPVGMLWASRYGVGWTIHGCVMPVASDGVSAAINHVTVPENDAVLNTSSTVELLKKCYVLEFTENLHEPQVGLSCDDQRMPRYVIWETATRVGYCGNTII